MKRLGHALAALVAAFQLAACGGRDFAPVTLVATAAPPPHEVRLDPLA